MSIEIEKFYQRCEFDDECDFCDSPEGGSYVSMSSASDGVDAEANFYICGKCAPGHIEKEIKDAEAWCDEMERQLHHPDCDTLDKNPEGIKKPCNCGVSAK